MDSLPTSGNFSLYAQTLNNIKGYSLQHICNCKNITQVLTYTRLVKQTMVHPDILKRLRDMGGKETLQCVPLSLLTMWTDSVNFFFLKCKWLCECRLSETGYRNNLINLSFLQIICPTHFFQIKWTNIECHKITNKQDNPKIHLTFSIDFTEGQKKSLLFNSLSTSSEILRTRNKEME